MFPSHDIDVGLDKALEFLKDGDTLVVWKLDRLGRSLAHLISVITDLKSKNISFNSQKHSKKWLFFIR